MTKRWSILTAVVLSLVLGVAGAALAQDPMIEPFGASPAPLTPAIKVGNTIYVSGQVPLDAEGNLVGDDITSQTRQVLDNLEQVLTMAGATPSDVVKTMVILTDVGRDYGEMNGVYAEFFPDPLPARSVIGAQLASSDWLIEIEAIAVIDAQGSEVAAIDELSQQWQTRANAGDAQGVADLYTEDAILHPGNGGMIEGRDAIRDHMQQNIDAGFGDANIESVETEILNGVAYSTGTWSAASPDGQTSDGHWLVVFLQEDGEWRMHRHTNNMNLPE